MSKATRAAAQQQANQKSETEINQDELQEQVTGEVEGEGQQDQQETSTAETPAPADKIEEAAPVAEAASAPVVPAVPETEGWMSNLSKAGASVIADFKSYIEAMQPGKPQASGPFNQVHLYRAMQNAINNLDDDFDLVWEKILELVHEHRNGVFGIRHAFRFVPDMPLNPDDLQGFQRLMHLMIATADPQGRGLALKQINIVATLQFGVTEQGRNKLHAFYNIG